MAKLLRKKKRLIKWKGNDYELYKGVILIPTIGVVGKIEIR